MHKVSDRQVCERQCLQNMPHLSTRMDPGRRGSGWLHYTSSGSIAVGGSSFVNISRGWTAVDCNKYDVCISTRPCVAGTYDNGERSCVSCPAGWSSFKGQASCNPCDKGKYSKEPGSVCLDCPAGWFQDQSSKASVTCRACPSGYNVPVTGSAICESPSWTTAADCTTSQYLDDRGNKSEWSCEPCLEGISCTDTNLTLSDIKRAAVFFGWARCPSAQVEKCPFRAACLALAIRRCSASTRRSCPRGS